MRIALINPPASRRYVQARDEPLQLEYLAASVRDRADVWLVDAFGLDLSTAETLDVLAETKPDVVGVSLNFAASSRPSLDILRGVREALPEATTLLGGNTATFRARDLCLDPAVDAVVVGEADLTFPEIVDALAVGSPLDGVPGLCIERQGRAVTTKDRPLVENLDALPFPARDLLPLGETYTRSVLTARGCSYGCIYCSATAFWRRRTRIRSVDGILAEVATLVRDKAAYFSFADDCFTIRPERAMAVCDGLAAMGGETAWSCTGRIETISPELLERMAATGCRMIFFGVESGSPRILARLKRRYTPKRVEEVYAMCLAHGIVPSFSFIVGLPFEEPQDVAATFELIRRLEGVECGVHMLTPFPGTPIADKPNDFELTIAPHRAEDLDINTRSFIDTPFADRERTQQNFYDGMGLAMGTVRRKRRFLEHYRPRPGHEPVIA
ncbi:Radical SAM domain protein [Alkalidesulfovibrio alkalitolerans DSM 16529]|uniref:Radical SAM domain protein n=1 Tax=Alkalidesulfovibrio alkalitolerans DSM 16529 TaxID=1121439 RepID=S7TCD8_9BACT|nr:radical SAM protein [Alkalidesulfovibrio alkalitolerans]EPR34286.1 Radical SAM domain protein [Alkalidesulfovibrio alkalitolerans DSM 16529]